MVTGVLGNRLESQHPSVGDRAKFLRSNSHRRRSFGIRWQYGRRHRHTLSISIPRVVGLKCFYRCRTTTSPIGHLTRIRMRTAGTSCSASPLPLKFLQISCVQSPRFQAFPLPDLQNQRTHSAELQTKIVTVQNSMCRASWRTAAHANR